MYGKGELSGPEDGMGALLAWFAVVVVLVAGLLVLFHLGMNIDAQVSSGLHHLEHLLGQPLVLPGVIGW
jgi:hypothetical protein